MKSSCDHPSNQLSFGQFVKLLFLIIVLTTIYFVFTVDYCILYKNELYTVPITHHKGYAIKTEGCHIPEMEPINKAIEKYIHYPKKLKPCPHTNYSLLEQNGTHIRFIYDTRVLRHYKINNTRKIMCCYSSFYRPDNIKNINDRYIDQRIDYNKCKFFNNTIKVKDEFVRVQCVYGMKVLINQFFIFVPHKNLTLNNKETKPTTMKKPGYNVLIIGIDNISRLNFHRTMPKTDEFMKNHGAVEMMGYNKVGANSLPNLVPLLMGYSVNEIKHICHPVPMTTFDDCPFLWHRFKDAGYYTAFGEDSSRLGTFNFGLKGFRKTPTDYYLHPFISQAEKVSGNSRDYNVNLCVNEIYLYQILLDYIQEITKTLRDSKLFGFFWETTMSHDELNYSMKLDESYLHFFKALKKSGYLDKTIIFLMSDHGIRWGSFRKTNQGYLEERLPLANILLPPSFRKEYTEAYNNLKYNTRQLTTPFDIHETLLDLVNIETIKNKQILERVRKPNVNNRAISLFLKVPQTRTCKSAGIEDHWCACHRREAISKTSEMAILATEHLIKHIDELLTEYPQCAKLELQEIIRSSEIVWEINPEDMKELSKEYSVTVSAKPSGGLFEGTLLNHGPNWTVRGDVSRLNLYGDQSVCVSDGKIKLYCYCVQDNNTTEQQKHFTTRK